MSVPSTVSRRLHNLLCAAVLLCGVVLCSGCYKGNGTETPPRQYFELPAEDPHAAEKEAKFTDVSEDAAAKKDYPFALDVNTVTEPAHDILLVMIYDNYENGRTQTINFYDKNGYAYRYRQPLDTTADNWFDTLLAYYPTAAPVNQMSAEEQKTLWYLSSQSSVFADTPLASEKDIGHPVGVRSLYLMTATGEPVLLARYDDTVLYRDNAEVTSFANWFRYFFHGTYQYPTVS